MSIWNKFTDWLGFEWVRARDEKGRFVADDKSTPNVDESKKRVYKSKKKKKQFIGALAQQGERWFCIPKVTGSIPVCSTNIRRGGRVVECTGLENRQGGNSFEGSNPSLSATAYGI